MQSGRGRTPGPFPLPRPSRLQWGSGFPRDMPTPIVRFRCTGLSKLRWSDAYYHDGNRWVISERLKGQFEALDPEAFDIIPIETQLANGEPGPPRWMCEVVRFRDAFHRERSREFGLEIVEIAGQDSIDGRVGILANGNACFDAAQLSGALFWREAFARHQFCREAAKCALVDASITNLRFSQVGWAW